MRNPIGQLARCWRWWRRFRSLGCYAWPDAMMQWSRVVLPARFAWREAGRQLERRARIRPEEEGIQRIELPGENLVFYWKGIADNNLWFLIEQELSRNNPHCYTTPPIRLLPESRVIDVGACEGLFAYRLLRSGACREVICFEPDPDLATWLWRGGVENGVARGLRVEPVAVARTSGPVRILPGSTPDALRIEPCPQGEGYAFSLDDYLADRGLRLGSEDLIKIDAEGADLQVIEGAQETIARDRPQIAVTTYHEDVHAEAILSLLARLNPDYTFRLKGLSHWTVVPRPVLLQASVPGATVPRRYPRSG